MMMMMMMIMMIIMIIITIITIITIIIIIVIIALKGANGIFYNLLTAPRTVSNMYFQTAHAQSCANHVQHIGRSSRATCVPRGTKGQPSY